MPPISTRHFGLSPAVPFSRDPLPAARMIPRISESSPDPADDLRRRNETLVLPHQLHQPVHTPRDPAVPTAMRKKSAQIQQPRPP